MSGDSTDELIEKLENIRGFKVIASEPRHVLVDIRDFGMDAPELIARLSEHGICVHECGSDCIRIDADAIDRKLIDVIASSIKAWGRDLARRNIEDVLKGGMCVGRRDCEYYPCHFEGQDCTFCFCPFYPCDDARTGGRYVESSTGGMVWSCVDCTIIHEPDVAQEMLDELMALEPGSDMRAVFRKTVARRLSGTA
jgi:threonine-phosphate decarboxylase